MPGPPRRGQRSTPRSTPRPTPLFTPMRGFLAARRLVSSDDASGETSDSMDDNNATVVNAVVHASQNSSPHTSASNDDASSAGAHAARTDDSHALASSVQPSQPEAVQANPTELLMQQLHVANARIASLRREADEYREQNIVLGTSMACFEARELERSLADFEAFERRAQASIGPPVSPGLAQQRDGAQPDASIMDRRTAYGHPPLARSTDVNSHARPSYVPPPRSALAAPPLPDMYVAPPPAPHVIVPPASASHVLPTAPLTTYAHNVPTSLHAPGPSGPHTPSSYVLTPATPSPHAPPQSLVHTYRPATPAQYSSAWPAQPLTSLHPACQIPVRADGTHPSPVTGTQAHDPLTLSLLEEVRRLRAHIEQQDERSRGCSIGTQPHQPTMNTAAHPATSNDATVPPHTLSNATDPLRSHDPARRSAYFDHWRAHELPTFSGLVEDWPMFSDAYWSSTERFGYSDYENMQRLRKALTGEAHQRVRSLLMNERHVTSVMQSLEMQFGRPDMLVRSQIEAVRAIAPITDRNLERLSSFAADVLNLSVFLDTAATQHHLANPSLMDELLLKLPTSRQYDWVVHSNGIRPYPTVKDLANWLSTVARMVSLLPKAPNNQPSSKQPPKGKHVMLQLDQEEVKPSTPAATNPFSPNCGFCSKVHRIADCQAFRALTPAERMKEATSRRWCIACMRPGHKANWCRHKRGCGIDNCSQVHHPLLHETEASSHPYPAPDAKSEPTHHLQPVVTTHNACKVNSEAHPNSAPSTPAALGPLTRCDPTVLYRMIPVTLHGYAGRRIDTYALLDNGSAFTMLDADVARELQLAGPMIEHAVQFCDGSGTKETSTLINVAISSSTNRDRRFNMSNVRTTRNLKLPTQSIHRGELVKRYPYLRDLPLHDYTNAVPKMLIGLPHVSLTEPLQTVGGPHSNGPIATLTELGWVVFGPQASPNGDSPTVVMHCCQVSAVAETRIDDVIRDYFTTENFGVKKPERALESDEDTRARRMLETTTLRVGSRFETGLLWRRDDIKLPDSYPMALRRLKSIECKMRRDSEFARLYDGHISAYVAKGYARKLSRIEADIRGPRTWYLPHFGVQNPNKPGKFRMVFDAAAEVGGTSLNSVLSTGPDQNQPLTTVLFQFRLGSVAICGDIREMFHQVRVRSEDQDSQRFLWRHGTANIEPDTYVMTVMTFGATCSPASAQFVKNKNASEFEHAFPEAAQAIRTRHYVDDYVASFKTEEEAIRVTMDVVDVHKRGGFELRGFVSNRPLVLAAVGEESQCMQPTCLPTETGATDKILGMQWDTGEDTFLFAMNFHRASPEVLSGRKPPTKRQLLSIAMSVFDPFGILADFLVHTKLMVQELWKAGVGWDEIVPTHVAEWWHAWLSEMEQTKLCRLPRCYSPHIYAATELQLHVFADASESAFAAVAYWRVTHDGQHATSFIIGKTKCAPLKLLTVPRLELQAAVLATRLHCTIRESHDVRIGQVVMWTDSMTVLRWVQSDQRRFKPFVAHRVAEVLDGVGSGCWRWLPTADNVADDGTRAKAKPRFDPESRWLRGPAFLQHDEADWPGTSVAAPRPDEDEEEIRARFVGVQAPFIALVSLTQFSRFERIRRTMGYVLRFVHNCSTASGRRQELRRRGGLTATELRTAEKALCRLAQIDAYPEEYHALQGGRKIDKHSPILSLMPYLDGEGVLRLYGRTDAASEEHLPLEMKRPILLPKTHSLTTLVARYFHDKMRHTSEDGTMGAIRQRFWIPHLRTLVRRTKRNCLACRIRAAEPVAPIMGQLPIDRMTPYVRPFQFTGIDYFGPVFVTVGRRREKRWVALFTCLTIRAVHLELAADLTADACLVCIRNFCNTRGVPMRIRSDNGTNFIGANNEIRRSRDFFDDQTIRNEIAERGIEWVFNCPGNPEAGGAWERLVQSVKRVLAVTLKETAPRVETLRGLLLEAANLVNSRPLTHVPVSPTDEEPLTPNHFLLGHNNAAMSSALDDEHATCLRKQWRISQQLTKRFWVRWVKEYLPELTRRTKLQREATPLKVGDLVLVCDSGQARGQWRRGRVTRVVVGTDGRVRTAELRTADGTLCRPVSKLAVLDVSGESPVESSHGGRDVVA